MGDNTVYNNSVTGYAEDVSACDAATDYAFEVCDVDEVSQTSFSTECQEAVAYAQEACSTVHVTDTDDAVDWSQEIQCEELNEMQHFTQMFENCPVASALYALYIWDWLDKRTSRLYTVAKNTYDSLLSLTSDQKLTLLDNMLFHLFQNEITYNTYKDIPPFKDFFSFYLLPITDEIINEAMELVFIYIDALVQELNSNNINNFTEIDYHFIGLVIISLNNIDMSFALERNEIIDALRGMGFYISDNLNAPDCNVDFISFTYVTPYNFVALFCEEESLIPKLTSGEIVQVNWPVTEGIHAFLIGRLYDDFWFLYDQGPGFYVCASSCDDLYAAIIQAVDKDEYWLIPELYGLATVIAAIGVIKLEFGG